MTIEIWGSPDGSSNVLKVHWLLAELDLPFEMKLGEGPFGSSRSAAYLAQNPNGRVPLLVDGDFSLWESNAILRYLGERWTERGLLPSELESRAIVNQWMDWSALTLGPAFSPAFMGLARTAENRRDSVAIANSLQRTAELLAILGGQLSRSHFVAGDDFTIADMHPAIIVRRVIALAPELDLSPSLLVWFHNISLRAAFLKVVAPTPVN